MNQLVERRRELDPEERVTVTDVLVKVCAAALMRHRAVNVQFTEEELLVFPYANIAIAVATDRGLMVPVSTAPSTFRSPRSLRRVPPS